MAALLCYRIDVDNYLRVGARVSLRGISGRAVIQAHEEDVYGLRAPFGVHDRHRRTVGAHMSYNSWPEDRI